MRDGLRFASDLTDAEWAVLQPLLPPPASVGRPPAWPMRMIVDAIFYVLRGGIPWRVRRQGKPIHRRHQEPIHPG
jgi:putative transposase